MTDVIRGLEMLTEYWPLRLNILFSIPGHPWLIVHVVYEGCMLKSLARESHCWQRCGKTELPRSSEFVDLVFRL